MPFDQVNFRAVETDEVLSVLIDARRLLEKPENWIKDNGFDYNGRLPNGMCALNATGAASFTHGRYIEVGDYLARFLPDSFGYVHLYNDHPDTTHADILALFDRAISARRGELS